MAEPDFEARLSRLFAEPPPLADSEAFARQVEARLAKGWGLRQVAIWVAGLGGGMVGVTQMLSSGAFFRYEAVSQDNIAAASRGLATFWRSAVLGGDLAALPLGGEAMWLAAALGAIALAFAITRAVEEF